MNPSDGNVPSRYKQMLQQQQKMPIHRISVRSSTKWITLKWRRCDGSVCELNDVSQKQRHACVAVCACVRVWMHDFIGCTVRTQTKLVHVCNVKRQRIARKKKKKMYIVWLTTTCHAFQVLLKLFFVYRVSTATCLSRRQSKNAYLLFLVHRKIGIGIVGAAFSCCKFIKCVFHHYSTFEFV